MTWNDKWISNIVWIYVLIIDPGDKFTQSLYNWHFLTWWIFTFIDEIVYDTLLFYNHTY